MSPGVTASVDGENCTVTVLLAPAASGTRAKPTSRRSGTTIRPLLTGWCTHTGTTSVPSRPPVFASVNVTVTVPLRPTVGVTARWLVENVVYDRPNPIGYSGL